MSKISEFFTVERCAGLNKEIAGCMGVKLNGKQIQQVMMKRGRGNYELRNRIVKFYEDLDHGLDTMEREQVMYMVSEFLLGEKLAYKLDMSDDGCGTRIFSYYLFLIRAREHGWEITKDWDKELDKFLDDNYTKYSKYDPDHNMTAEEIAEKNISIRLDDRYKSYMIMERIHSGLLSEKQLAKGAGKTRREKLEIAS